MLRSRVTSFRRTPSRHFQRYLSWFNKPVCLSIRIQTSIECSLELWRNQLALNWMAATKCWKSVTWQHYYGPCNRSPLRRKSQKIWILFIDDWREKSFGRSLVFSLRYPGGIPKHCILHSGRALSEIKDLIYVWPGKFYFWVLCVHWVPASWPCISPRHWRSRSTAK